MSSCPGRYDLKTAMINTRKVTDRRILRFGRVEDILKDVEWLNSRSEAGITLRASGNWTPAQVVDHVAKGIGFAIDGFPPEAKAPLPIRVILKMMKSSILLKPTKPGIKLKGKQSQALGPDASVTWGQAVTRMRNVIGRLHKGERMTAESPILGLLAPEEWNQFQCRHAELHLSFVHAG